MEKRHDFLKFGNGHPFDPDPRFVNHMSHWVPWAHHYQDAPGETGILALMLGFAMEEIDRLRKRCLKTNKARAHLLFAFIDLVETKKPKPFPADLDKPESLSGAWASIQLFNKWRKENKLNIRAVDVD